MRTELSACHAKPAEGLRANEVANAQQVGIFFCGREASLPHRLAAEIWTSQTQQWQSPGPMLLSLAEARSVAADQSPWRWSRRQKDAPRQRQRQVSNCASYRVQKHSRIALEHVSG